MNELKKMLTFIAAVVVTVALFAACNPGDGGTETTAPVADATTTDPVGEAAAPAERDVISFSISPTHDALTPGADDEVFRFIQDTLNVRINPIIIEDNTVMAVMAASGDLPDVFMINTFGHDNFYTWIDQGILRSIPRDMIERFHYVSRMVNWSRELATVAEVRGGEVWFLPRPFDYEPLLTASSMRIWYRADWVENLGMSTPQTTDDLWEMLRAFAEEDPAGDGRHLFPMTSPGNWPLLALITMFSGLDNDGWSQVDGQWTPNFANERQLAGIQFFRDAFVAGFIDPEFSITGVNPSLEALAAGSVGLVPRNGADPWWLMRTSRFLRDVMGEGYTEYDAWNTGAIRIMPPLVAPGNDRSFWPPATNGDGWVINSRVDDETLEVILDFFDWGTHPDQVVMSRHGIEGVSWSRNPDGSIHRYIDPETDAPFNTTVTWPGTVLLNEMTWDFNQQWDFNEPETFAAGHNHFREESLRINVPYNAAGIDDGEAFILRVARLPHFMDFLDFVDPLTGFVEIITGTRPVQDMWDDMISEWNALGLQRAIEEANAFMANR